VARTGGYGASQQQFSFGRRPHVPAPFSQSLGDLILAPGNCPDVKALALSLDECAEECAEEGISLQDQTWLVDCGSRRKKVEEHARLRHGLTLRVGLPAEGRRPIERVISLWCSRFHLEDGPATTGSGRYRRFQAKITAFNRGRSFNHGLGREALDLAR
jgi:hypothetical protein